MLLLAVRCLIASARCGQGQTATHKMDCEMPDAAPAGARNASCLWRSFVRVGEANIQSQASPTPTVIYLHLPQAEALGLSHLSSSNGTASMPAGSPAPFIVH